MNVSYTVSCKVCGEIFTTDKLDENGDFTCPECSGKKKYFYDDEKPSKKK
jgi:formylmethanofuran dehydrogenase subunit E